MSFTGWLTPAGVYVGERVGRVDRHRHHPAARIDVSAYETKRVFATAKDGVKIPYTLDLSQGPASATAATPAWISRLRLLRRGRLHADLRRPDPGAGRRRLHRRLRQRARRRRIRPRMAQGRPARQQAQHLARPDRRLRGPVRRRTTPRRRTWPSAAAPPAASPWAAP